MNETSVDATIMNQIEVRELFEKGIADLSTDDLLSLLRSATAHAGIYFNAPGLAERLKHVQLEIENEVRRRLEKLDLLLRRQSEEMAKKFNGAI